MEWKNLLKMKEPNTVAIAVFLLVCVVQAGYVYFLAVDVPVWDQWDMEAEWYKHLIDRTWNIESLIAPHNEHRLVFTRLFHGGLFILLGGWSPLIGMYAQIPLVATVAAMLTRWLAKFAPRTKHASVVLVLVVFSLPFAWETILISFQSHFYFLILLSLLAIYLAAASENRYLLALSVALAILSPFTMANGFGTIVVLWGIFLLRSLRSGHRRLFQLAALAVLSAAIFLHAEGLVHVSYHDKLRAQNGGEFIVSFVKILGWPEFPIGIIAWCAIATAILRWLIARGNLRRAIESLSGTQLFVLGLIAWYLVQVAATAYARTHSDLMSARYQYNFALIIPIVFLTVEAFELRVKSEILLRTVYAIFLIGLLIRTGKEIPYMQRNRATSLFALEHIRGAVARDDFAYLKSHDASGRLGYFNAERIWQQVRYPGLRQRNLWLGMREGH